MVQRQLMHGSSRIQIPYDVFSFSLIDNNFRFAENQTPWIVKRARFYSGKHIFHTISYSLYHVVYMKYYITYGLSADSVFKNAKTP